MGIEWRLSSTMILMVEVDGRIIRGNDSHLKHDKFTLYFRFCQSISPDITIGNEKGLTILFTSDMEETGGGAQCTAECVEEKLEATTLKSSGKNVNVKFNVLQYIMDFLKTTFVLTREVRQ